MFHIAKLYLDYLNVHCSIKNSKRRSNLPSSYRKLLSFFDAKFAGMGRWRQHSHRIKTTSDTLREPLLCQQKREVSAADNAKT